MMANLSLSLAFGLVSLIFGSMEQVRILSTLESVGSLELCMDPGLAFGCGSFMVKGQTGKPLLVQGKMKTTTLGVR